MGTNSLFTKKIIPVVDSTVSPNSLQTVQELFTYLTCKEWARLAQPERAEDSSYSDEEVEPSSLSSFQNHPQTFQIKENKEQTVHLVFPDGTVQGTQLAHHLVSAMLCQNTELFHPNAMQSVLAALLVFLLKQPFKSRGWYNRQLEWIALSYDRAYTLASCKGAATEHLRFKMFVASLMNEETFRSSLITDALNHPRELRCQGLSKAILGMWMGSRLTTTEKDARSISTSLLKRWRLGLIGEMFHRLGLFLEVQVCLFACWMQFETACFNF